jgi:hypothetical protein
MRYPIKISTPWQPLFRVFGFSPKRSFVAIEDGTLAFRFGTATEAIPLADVSEVVPRRWPFYYGLGPKLGPDDGVSYVGSTEGVVQVRLKKPHALNVWGPFAHRKARAITVSLEEPDDFIAAVEQARSATR